MNLIDYYIAAVAHDETIDVGEIVVSKGVDPESNVVVWNKRTHTVVSVWKNGKRRF